MRLVYNVVGWEGMLREGLFGFRVSVGGAGGGGVMFMCFMCFMCRRGGEELGMVWCVWGR